MYAVKHSLLLGSFSLSFRSETAEGKIFDLRFKLIMLQSYNRPHCVPCPFVRPCSVCPVRAPNLKTKRYTKTPKLVQFTWTFASCIG